MNDVVTSQPENQVPKWFAVIAWIAFVWNLMGVMAFVSQMMMTAEAIAQMPENEQILYQNVPIWATLAFAFAVIGGALGSLLMALKKSLAVPVLILSLIGVLVQMYHVFFIINSVAVYGPGSAVMPGMVIIISILLVFFANKAKSSGWLS